MWIFLRQVPQICVTLQTQLHTINFTHQDMKVQVNDVLAPSVQVNYIHNYMPLRSKKSQETKTLFENG